MNEVLESCHLCGADMGSRAPICPKCFARADPSSREEIRLERARLKSEQLRLAAEARARQREEDQSHAELVMGDAKLVMVILAIIVIVGSIASCIYE